MRSRIGTRAKVIAIAAALAVGVIGAVAVPTGATEFDVANIGLRPALKTPTFEGAGIFDAESRQVLDLSTAILPITGSPRLIPGYSYAATANVFNNAQWTSNAVTLRVLGAPVAGRADATADHLVSLSVNGTLVLDRVPVPDAVTTITLPPRAAVPLGPGEVWTGDDATTARIDLTFRYQSNSTTNAEHDAGVQWRLDLTSTASST